MNSVAEKNSRNRWGHSWRRLNSFKNIFFSMSLYVFPKRNYRVYYKAETTVEQIKWVAWISWTPTPGKFWPPCPPRHWRWIPMWIEHSGLTFLTVSIPAISASECSRHYSKWFTVKCTTVNTIVPLTAVTWNFIYQYGNDTVINIYIYIYITF